jgi:GT2 family glycosyltransferase
MSKISIHLVVWNGEKYLEDCLNSILEQTHQDYLLIIIDNGSVDKSVNLIEKQFLPIFGEKMRLIKNKENLGFARAHNQAILWTDSDYILVLNQDVILEKNFLEEIMKFCEQKKNFGSLTGKILRWQFELTDDLKKSQKTDIIDSLGLKIFRSQRTVDIAAGAKDSEEFKAEKEIFGVAAACAIYSRQAINDVRYKDEFFDNDFFSYKEDVDLAYRLRWRGWKSFYLSSALAYHKRSAKSQEKISFFTSLKLRKNKARFVNYHSYKNHLFVLKKNLSFKNFVHNFFSIFFYELKKFLYILFLEWSTLASLKEYFAKKKKMQGKRKYIMANRLVKDEEVRKWFN